MSFVFRNIEDKFKTMSNPENVSKQSCESKNDLKDKLEELSKYIKLRKLITNEKNELDKLVKISNCEEEHEKGKIINLDLLIKTINHLDEKTYVNVYKENGKILKIYFYVYLTCHWDKLLSAENSLEKKNLMDIKCHIKFSNSPNEDDDVHTFYFFPPRKMNEVQTYHENFSLKMKQENILYIIPYLNNKMITVTNPNENLSNLIFECQLFIKKIKIQQ